VVVVHDKDRLMIGSSLFGPSYYRVLSVDEIDKIKLMESQINSGKPSDLIAAVKSLQALSQEDVVRFTQTGATPQALSQEDVMRFTQSRSTLRKFCETNTALQKTWLETLNKHYKKTPNQVVESLQGEKEKHPIFHHYVSAYLLNAFLSYKHVLVRSAKNSYSGTLKAKVENLLNEACDLGSYYALLKRSQRNYEELAAEDKSLDTNIIFNDAMRLKHLYGEIGCIQAGNILLDLSDYFNEGDRDMDRGIVMFEQGIKNYMCALLLSSHEYSQQLTKRLTAGEGIASIFSTEDGGAELADAFRDPVKAKALLLSMVGKDNYDRLRVEASRETAPILKRGTMHSDTTPSLTSSEKK
jgi:hypothetical protein